MTCYLKLCHFKQLLFLYYTQRAMSKCALKRGFTARCSDISHNKKLNICCSVDSWNAPPQSIHLCARQLFPQALQDFRALTLLTNMAEEENSQSLSDHWLLTWLCLWDLFTEHVLLAKTEVNEKMAAGSEETWLGKGSSRETQAGFYSGYPLSALCSPSTWVAPINLS